MKGAALKIGFVSVSKAFITRSQAVVTRGFGFRHLQTADF
jgi:hypothetical protein